MDIINPGLDNYLADLLPERDSALIEMEQYASKNKFPIIGPQVGTFLSQMAYITSAERIFELGSGYGYSSYWFSKGMPRGGHIICTDGDEQNKVLAEKYHKQCGFTGKIEFFVGDAREIIQNHNGPFDIIFNDIDKEQYPDAFELALPRLKKGGLFITDNVLWSGRVLEDEPDESTLGIIEFNKMLFGSNDLISSIVPIRDGLGMAVKK